MDQKGDWNQDIFQKLFVFFKLLFDCTVQHVGVLVPPSGIEHDPLQWHWDNQWWTTSEVPSEVLANANMTT